MYNIRGSLLSYNLYSYCEGNVINNVDPSGNDAIYVVDFNALPVLGHAILYYQYDGKWLETEFTGFNFAKKLQKYIIVKFLQVSKVN